MLRLSSNSSGMTDTEAMYKNPSNAQDVLAHTDTMARGNSPPAVAGITRSEG